VRKPGYTEFSGGAERRQQVRFPVSLLLSINYFPFQHNWRSKVRAYAANDDFPLLDSVIGVWASANWYRREAFDLYGIWCFDGHPDFAAPAHDYGTLRPSVS
jgi:NADH-quinone oxidoreductase subunit C